MKWIAGLFFLPGQIQKNIWFLSGRACRNIVKNVNPKEFYQVAIESTEDNPYYRLTIQNRSAYEAKQRLKLFQFRIVGEVVSSNRKLLTLKVLDKTLVIHSENRRHEVGEIVLVKARWNRDKLELIHSTVMA